MRGMVRYDKVTKQVVSFAKVSMQLASLSSSPCAALSHPPASNGQSVVP